MKGQIQADHIPLHKYQLSVVGMGQLDFTSVSGIEEELDKIELPDRTVASGGRTKPIEFSAKLPLHHVVQQVLMEEWFQEGQDPVLPTYKRAATLTATSLTGGLTRSYAMTDLFPTKRSLPDFEMNNEGEMAETEWMFAASDILPF